VCECHTALKGYLLTYLLTRSSRNRVNSAQRHYTRRSTRHTILGDFRVWRVDRVTSWLAPHSNGGAKKGTRLQGSVDGKHYEPYHFSKRFAASAMSYTLALVVSSSIRILPLVTCAHRHFTSGPHTSSTGSFAGIGGARDQWCHFHVQPLDINK